MTITGRTLDADGSPVPGTGFDLNPDGDLAALLRERTGALTSHPTQAVWSAPLPAPDDGDAIRSVGIHEPGFDGPPEHYHEESVEVFDVRSGAATFLIDDREVPVAAGERLTVDTGQRHTFRVEGDERCHMVVEIRSPGKLRHVLPTLGGLAHDDAASVEDPLQAAALADRLDGNTTFTTPSEAVVRPLSAALAPVARLAGYEGAYDKYTRDAFWERHVEQPAL
jgi:mannose-6-phosphate isomerase-like protein (cupin superfamily)